MPPEFLTREDLLLNLLLSIIEDEKLETASMLASVRLKHHRKNVTGCPEG